MIMEGMDDEFLDLVADFLESSKRLREASELCEDDPIKQDMIKHIVQPFREAYERSNHVRHLSEVDYEGNRSFILKELREIAELNNSMAEQIEKKLIPLAWN